jgi:hypothetical protein
VDIIAFTVIAIALLCRLVCAVISETFESRRFRLEAVEGFALGRLAERFHQGSDPNLSNQ